MAKKPTEVKMGVRKRGVMKPKVRLKIGYTVNKA